ncbi:MAG: protein-S-isoprenylcysteine O-methyltransferase [Cyanobacteria bacterium P01_D01_bin.115]
MAILALKIIFLMGLVSSSIIRMPHQRVQQQNVIADDRKTTQEKALLVAVFLGMFILPMLYILTPWLGFANYSLPVWANILGVLIFAISLWLFWRSHHDLGKNWSPTLQVREDHTLITDGIYLTIRHPMYTAIWLWAMAQGLLLTNWIVGLSGILTFGTLYFLRIGNEEKMMLEQFGDQYQAYMQQTKRLLPYLL